MGKETGMNGNVLSMQIVLNGGGTQSTQRQGTTTIIN
jgi:hypothetical protein